MFTFIFLVDLSKVTDRFNDTNKNIVKRQNSRCERCDFTKENFPEKKNVYQKYVYQKYNSNQMLLMAPKYVDVYLGLIFTN